MHIGGTLPLPASYIQESYYLLGSSNDEESDEDVRRSSSPGGITSSVVLVLELEGGYNRVQKEQRTATYLLLRSPNKNNTSSYFVDI